MIRLPGWLRGTLAPDEIIGEHEMLRWMLLPRNRWFNVYLHKHQGDDPREPHDHPVDNISIRIRGGLVEFTPADVHRSRACATIDGVEGPIHAICNGDVCVWFGPLGDPYGVYRPLPRVRFRRAEQPHRLELLNDRPAWTLWIRFRNRRRWGYYEPSGWRPAVTVRQPV
jgi:hypothetical protein